MATRKTTTRKKSATRKAKKRTAKKAATKAKKPLSPAQRAHQVTWQLMGELKRLQIEYLRVGRMLAQVRDENLFADLQFADIETYAAQRLNLARSSLYKYLRVYDWVCRYHKEWLDPKPGVVIPELSDAANLIWIDEELAKKDLKAETRAKLEEFQKQGMAGTLKQSELAKWRRTRKRGTDTVKSIISTLHRARERIAALEPAIPEALEHLDAMVGILGNARTLKLAGLDTVLNTETPTSHPVFLA